MLLRLVALACFCFCLWHLEARDFATIGATLAVVVLARPNNNRRETPQRSFAIIDGDDLSPDIRRAVRRAF